MEITRAIDKSKVRKEKTREAIDLALKGRWEEAVQANREILRFFPTDVESLNRLGKALMETGQHGEAREAFQETLKHSPHNGIAKKNLERLERLKRKGRQGDPHSRVAAHRFVEESGKSGVTMLIRAAEEEVLERVAPGDAIEIEAEGQVLLARSVEGEYLGQVEPRLAVRLSRLMSEGNRYEGAIVSVKRDRVAVLLVEVFRHPSQAGVPSFPTRGSGDYRTVFQDTVLEYRWNEEERGRDLDTSVEWDDDANESFHAADGPRGPEAN